MLHTHRMAGKNSKGFQSSKVKSETRILEEIVGELVYSLGVGRTFELWLMLQLLGLCKNYTKVRHIKQPFIIFMVSVGKNSDRAQIRRFYNVYI